MAYSHGRLVTNGITTIASSAGALVTNAASTTTYIRAIVVHNSNTTTEYVKLYYVPDNAGSVGTAAVTNQIFAPAAGVLPGETVTIEFPAQGIVMTDTNDTIQGVTTTASKVTFMAFGGTE